MSGSSEVVAAETKKTFKSRTSKKPEVDYKSFTTRSLAEYTFNPWFERMMRKYCAMFPDLVECKKSVLDTLVKCTGKNATLWLKVCIDSLWSFGEEILDKQDATIFIQPSNLFCQYMQISSVWGDDLSDEAIDLIWDIVAGAYIIASGLWEIPERWLAFISKGNSELGSSRLQEMIDTAVAESKVDADEFANVIMYFRTWITHDRSPKNELAKMAPDSYRGQIQTFLGITDILSGLSETQLMTIVSHTTEKIGLKKEDIEVPVAQDPRESVLAITTRMSDIINSNKGGVRTKLSSIFNEQKKKASADAMTDHLASATSFLAKLSMSDTSDSQDTTDTPDVAPAATSEALAPSAPSSKYSALQSFLTKK